MIRSFLKVLGVAAVIAASAALLAAQAPVVASGAWVREPVTGRPTTAAYVVLENPGNEDIQIVSAATNVAGNVELHEMVREGDTMKMAPVKSITVPAKGKVELKPGGLHIMLFNLKQPLKEGDTVPLTLSTNRGWTVRVQAPVKKGGM
jgi:hypothetical protein